MKPISVERQQHQEPAQPLKQKLAAAHIPVLANSSHIVPVVVGNPVHCKEVSDTLLDQFGMYV